jgi:UDP-N-acetylglucosamine 2-epimerase (non-hydrolysing)/GDP/UDP-N,N'-diacetylbacillosamine 2-epimerase (hydrolysing)
MPEGTQVESAFSTVPSVRRKIAVVTSSRADYAHVRWLLHELGDSPKIGLQVIALGPHLSPVFGNTGKNIGSGRKADFPLEQVECLLDSDTDVGMAKTIGVATLGVADALSRLRPDIVVLIADRYEMLAPASAALALRIPIAHVEGGEITAGAIDDAVRNALTKMSHLHFACTQNAARRIADMGEEPWRITFSGSLSLDALRRERLLTRAQLQKRLGFEIMPDSVVCIYHPVTMLPNPAEEAEEVFRALGALRRQITLIYPNADAGGRQLVKRAKEFANGHDRARVLVNLDHLVYLSLLKHSGVLIGNSSSGIIESTSLGVPAINVGIRQRGREHAKNVIDVPATAGAIETAVKVAFSGEFGKSLRHLENPYGKGNAARIIRRVLAQAPLGAKLLLKHAHLL